MKYLGIDFGDTHIGIALGDTGSIAVPFGIVQNDDGLMVELKRITRDESVDEIVVGWPVSLSGKENERTVKTDQFIHRLADELGLPIYKSDERMTSTAAEKKGVRGRVDAAAATDILQTYMDKHAAS